MKARNDNSQLVYQGNSLIEGAYNITLDETRFIYLALTKVDSMRPQPDGAYTLYPHEFEKLFGTNPKNTHRQLKEAASSLGKKPIFTYEWNERLKRVDKVERFWFSSIRYDASGGNSDVTVRFSLDVAEYLYELKREFTRLNIDVIAKLESPFAFRLYSWLISYRELARCQKNNGIIVTDPFEIEWMRERAGFVGKTYYEYRFFRRDVIEPAIKQINAKTDISVSWEPLKRGRKIHAIVFSYIIEDGSGTQEIPKSKPLRPRLPRRPHVAAGSDAEGRWARACLDLMTGYRAELHQYDDAEKLAVADLKKMQGWYLIIGDKISANSLDSEIKSRSRKRVNDC